MARPSAQNAKNRQMIADPGDLIPLGPPPDGMPPRVRHFWEESAALWPQLSQRDYQAFGDYCYLLVEQEQLRRKVEKVGRFTAKGGVVRENAYYKALVRAEARLTSFRRDFAALAGFRERAGAVRRPAPAGDDIDSL